LVQVIQPLHQLESNQLEGEDIIIETAGYRAKPRARTTTIHFTPPSDQAETQQLIPNNTTNTGGYSAKKLLNVFPPLD
jgi:hypothetical protein